MDNIAKFERFIFHLFLENGGIGNYSRASSGYVVRPTLYISPDVYRVSGTGTITDPYIIGMAS